MGELSGDRNHSWGKFLTVVLMVLIVIVASFLVASHFSAIASTTMSATNSTNPPIRNLVVCSGMTENETKLNQKILASNTRVANYDEQLWLGFSHNFTSMNYNVTAVAQNDTFGYGPGYILNGLTARGLWYQVGISWNWNHINGGHDDGFELFYQVWNATSHKAVYPFTDGSTYPKSFPDIRANDIIGLSLSFSKGKVLMDGYDWRTKVEVNASYEALGANQFVSYKNHVSGFPSSLLVEWYHVLPYYCSNEAVR